MAQAAPRGHDGCDRPHWHDETKKKTKHVLFCVEWQCQFGLFPKKKNERASSRTKTNENIINGQGGERRPPAPRLSWPRPEPAVAGTGRRRPRPLAGAPRRQATTITSSPHQEREEEKEERTARRSAWFRVWVAGGGPRKPKSVTTSKLLSVSETTCQTILVKGALVGKPKMFKQTTRHPTTQIDKDGM